MKYKILKYFTSIRIVNSCELNSGGANWTAVAANCLSASSMAKSPRALVHHIFQWDGGGSVIELVGSFNQWRPIPVTNGNSNRYRCLAIDPPYAHGV